MDMVNLPLPLGLGEPQSLRLSARLAVVPASNKWGDNMAIRFHYLHRRVRSRRITYAVYFWDRGWRCVGFIQFGEMPAPALPRLLREAGMSHHHLIHLARLWLSEEAPKNSESCAIRKALRRLPGDWPWPPERKGVLSYHDEAAGQRGTVYRAAGFMAIGYTVGGYLGRSRRSKAGKSPPRSLRCGRFAWFAPLAVNIREGT